MALTAFLLSKLLEPGVADDGAHRVESLQFLNYDVAYKFVSSLE